MENDPNIPNVTLSNDVVEQLKRVLESLDRKIPQPSFIDPVRGINDADPNTTSQRKSQDKPSNDNSTSYLMRYLAWSLNNLDSTIGKLDKGVSSYASWSYSNFQTGLQIAKKGGEVSSNVLDSTLSAIKWAAVGEGVNPDYRNSRHPTDSDEAYPLAIHESVYAWFEKFGTAKFQKESMGAREDLRNLWGSHRAGDILSNSFSFGAHASQAGKMPLSLAVGGAVAGTVGGPITGIAAAGATSAAVDYVATPLFRLGKYLSDSIEGLRRWNDSLLASHFRFAEFSGAMAKVEADQEVRDILLSQQRGDRRSESAEYLAESRNRLEKDFAKVEDYMAIIVSNLTGRFLNEIADIKDLIKTWLNIRDDPDDPNQINMNEWINQIHNRQWDEEHGRPARFQGPRQP